MASGVEIEFSQEAPTAKGVEVPKKSAAQKRAVVLIHGLSLHPFSSDDVARANLQGWQLAGSSLVESLAKKADVFAMSYSQDVAYTAIAESEDLRRHIASLKEAGYSEIALVGHSAGGLIARHFVEDHPDSGVTKVVQVCSPNGGSTWGHAEICIRNGQELFLNALTNGERELCLAGRCEKKIPEQVQFVCVVGHQSLEVDVRYSVPLWRGRTINVSANKQFCGDGIVSTECQWPPDLRAQQVPVVALPIYHVRAMRNATAIEKIVELVEQDQPRLSADAVARLTEELLGETEGQVSLLLH
jgi:hypothetical protein